MIERFNIVTLTEYKRDLEKDLISETSGDFSKLIVALLKVRRVIPVLNLTVKYLPPKQKLLC